MTDHNDHPTAPAADGRMTTLPKEAWARIERRLRKTDDGCWIWTGATYPGGYGSVWVGSRRDGTGKGHRVHRLAYTALVGPIPHGLELDHLCRNPSCANPAHLEPVTHKENLRRGRSPVASRIDHVQRTNTCAHGHAYTEANTRYEKGGKWCRECNRLAGSKYDGANRQKRRDADARRRERLRALRGAA